MYIRHYIQWQQQKIARDGQQLLTTAATGIHDIAVDLFQQTGISYPKFFKMDILSRVAFIATELLLPSTIEADKTRIATVLSTGSGCLEVDKKFEESRHSLASPALFVYTLPNIMLGEIDIRHGFKGEQMCTATEKADPDWLHFYVTDLIRNRGTDACLCGHVEAAGDTIAATLLWVDRTPAPLPFTPEHLETIFSNTFP